MKINKNKASIYLLFKRLSPQISIKKRRILFALLLLTILSSIVDAISIGAVLPFLSAITNPEKLINSTIYSKYNAYLKINNSEDLVKFMTIGIVGATLLSAIFRWVVIYLQTLISNNITSELSIKGYERTLYQPYSVHIALNSSNIITGITKVNSILNNFITPTITLITSLFTITSICIGLLYLQPLLTFVLFTSLFFIYYLIISVTKKSLIKFGQRRNNEASKLTKAIQEGLGGIRDVLLDGTQPLYCEIYSKSDKPIKLANTYIQLIGLTPGIIVQALAIILIVILSFFLNKNSIGFVNSLPILGVIALGIQRMVPAFQAVYSSWSVIKSSVPTINEALNLLEQPLPNYCQENTNKKMSFSKTITLKNISFKYATNTPFVFNNLSVSIYKGTKVGFMGVTGSGKSTLIDIVMALLNPTEGTLEVDDIIIDNSNFRSWQRNLAHVPQSIYLTDSSVAENIAFGIPMDKIDKIRLNSVARQAKILETIEAMPQKFDTLIGERGIRLSGGQRQRIGIARALYKNANVIIFDEATSALDNNTENEVMEAIDSLGEDITVLIVAHRLTTLRNCDTVFELLKDNIIVHNNYKIK
jgi:ABC-type multidrug transport system fused ATPase/permease subunit